MSVAIDILLASGLVALALQTVAGPGLFRATITFIIFGLVMALIWARLGVPDLALAEAALGAGITGALLLAAIQRLVHGDPQALRKERRHVSRLALPVALLVSLLVAAIALSLTGAVDARPGEAATLAREALAGVELGNAVTAVLLLFRGYDTLLEMTVLLAASFGAFASSRASLGDDLLGPREREQSLLDALLTVIVPLAVLVAGYLLHAGGEAPGGAFQAGAVLGAAAVLLVLGRRLSPNPVPSPPERVAVVLGVVVFSLIGLLSLARGEGQLLALPGMWAVYAVEGAMMISIATILALLFVGGRGLRRNQR